MVVLRIVLGTNNSRKEYAVNDEQKAQALKLLHDTHTAATLASGYRGWGVLLSSLLSVAGAILWYTASQLPDIRFLHTGGIITGGVLVVAGFLCYMMLLLMKHYYKDAPSTEDFQTALYELGLEKKPTIIRIRPN